MMWDDIYEDRYSSRSYEDLALDFENGVISRDDLLRELGYIPPETSEDDPLDPRQRDEIPF